MNARESLPNGVEIMMFPYRGETVQIPVAPTFMDLKHVLHFTVVPGREGLAQAQKPGEIIGIGFMPYRYAADDLVMQNPEAAQALIQHLKAAGLKPADEPQKIDPIAPEQYSLISHLRKIGDHYWPLDSFREGTWVMGPVVIADIPRHPWFYDYVAEVEAATLHTELSVAVHGETLLADLALPEERDRIFYTEIVDILDRAFYPYKP